MGYMTLYLLMLTSAGGCSQTSPPILPRQSTSVLSPFRNRMAHVNVLGNLHRNTDRSVSASLPTMPLRSRLLTCWCLYAVQRQSIRQSMQLTRLIMEMEFKSRPHRRMLPIKSCGRRARELTALTIPKRDQGVDTNHCASCSGVKHRMRVNLVAPLLLSRG
eukprot:1645565-Amphidinium_carterae.1